jgi:hypothetical protein
MEAHATSADSHLLLTPEEAAWALAICRTKLYELLGRVNSSPFRSGRAGVDPQQRSRSSLSACAVTQMFSRMPGAHPQPFSGGQSSPQTTSSEVGSLVVKQEGEGELLAGLSFGRRHRTA